ncbi:MAG: hypothetical protein AAB409_08455 [Gemmatimonadota bacterium]
MSFVGVLAIILLLWGVIALVRRIAESEQERVDRGAGRRPSTEFPDGSPDSAPDSAAGRAASAHDDEIDREELERAEEQVRDLDVNARPEDGFEGDDWGPGAPKKPPLY